jgi:hypothetical protein
MSQEVLSFQIMIADSACSHLEQNVYDHEPSLPLNFHSFNLNVLSLTSMIVVSCIILQLSD